jgi:hypothetical protein
VKLKLRTRFWHWLCGIKLVPYTTLIATANRDGWQCHYELECMPGDETFCTTWRTNREREGMTITTRSGYKPIVRRQLTPAMRAASESHRRAGWPNSEEETSG